MNLNVVKAKKKWGQNFLIDEQVLEQIIEIAAVNKNDSILEIGAGTGLLTEKLLQENVKVTAVEIDTSLVQILKNKFKTYSANLNIIEGDILKTPLKDVFKNEKIKIVANLPYYITTPILFSLVESDLQVESMTLMLQKEVAERIVAKPNCKSYGVLSVMMQYYTEAKIMLEVEAKSFKPTPKVDSAVILLKKRELPPVLVCNEKLFFKFVKAAFAQRRKTLFNNLKLLNLKQDIIVESLLKMGLNEKVRGESLSLKEFAVLFDMLLERS